MKSLFLAAALAIGAVSSVAAAPVSGSARVDIYQQTPTGNADDSADATLANATGVDATAIGSAIYTGDFWFMTSNSNDSTTIDEWLTSASGSYTELGGGFDETLTISNPNIAPSANDALTTWFVFTALGDAFDFQVQHDDGLQIWDDDTSDVSNIIYESVQPQTAGSFSSLINWDGGKITFVYAATNGDPSVFKVKGDGNLTAVPLPAGAVLLLSGLGIMGALRMRRKA